jgi:Sulfotransferase family
VSSPLILLGVSRSGTTLLRVILDRSPGVAIPDESFFIPLLARRHGRTIDAERFLDDVARIPTIVDWRLAVADIAPRVRSGMATGDAIAAIFETFAARAGKRRWGDKTPMYMRHLALLERLFPNAQYVHLVRDGRDAALSFLEMPEGTFTRTWAHPRTPGQFACLWREEVLDARALRRRLGSERVAEVRYEELVAEPQAVVRGICAFAEIPFEPVMLDYVGAVDVSAKPHQQRLLRPPTTGVRSWREDMADNDVAAFEAVAGDLLGDLGYEVTFEPRARNARAVAARAWYDTRLAAWTAAASVVQRSPLWRRRHPRVST